MLDIVFYLGYFVLVLGLVFCLISVIGTIKMPDIYTKFHAMGVFDSFGLPLAFLGLSILAFQSFITLKIIFLGFFLILISALNTHMLIRASIKK